MSTNQDNDSFRQAQNTFADIIFRFFPVKRLISESNGEVIRRVSNIINLICRALTSQGVGMRCGNLCNDIELLGTRLSGIALSNKYVAMVAYFRTDFVEERASNESTKSPEGRPTHTSRITL